MSKKQPLFDNPRHRAVENLQMIPFFFLIS